MVARSFRWKLHSHVVLGLGSAPTPLDERLSGQENAPALTTVVLGAFVQPALDQVLSDLSCRPHVL